MKLQMACALLGVAMGTRGVIGDEELEWWKSDHWTLGKLWNHFDCNILFESERQIPSTETWMKMRQAYVDVVGSSESTIGEPNEVDGFFAPIEVQQSPGKGRGLFAAEDIPRGQHIWSGAIQMATFDSGLDYKKFLGSISDDDACDVLQYAYVVILGDDAENQDNARICVDLDNGSIMNSVDFDHDTVDAGCLPEWNDRFRGGCDLNLYALRDIKKGDEILMDYGLLGFQHWEWFGIGDPYEEDDVVEVHDDEELEWWESDHWTFRKLWSRFDCETAFESERQIPSSETWMKMRQAYVDVVGSSKSTIGEPDEADGFFAPIEGQQSPGKGRGLFATEDIPMGQHIWSGAIQGATFNSGIDYKKFLDSVEDACEVLQFSYVMILGDDKENQDNARICVNLDNGSLINNIDLVHDPVDAGCLPEWNDRFRGGCYQNRYALRDIKKGDEILLNYEASHFITAGWEWFGLANPDEEEDDDQDDDDEHDEYPECYGSRECCESDEWWKVDGCHLPDVAAFLWCEDFDEPLLVYSQAEWKKLRRTFHDIVGKNASSILTPTTEDGFFVSVEKSDSPRGLYAAQDIAKGHHIWTGTKQTAMFDNPTDYKTFLVNIPGDRACDIIHYLGHVQNFGDENGESKENSRIVVHLDDWAFVNFASDGKQASAGCLPDSNDQYFGGCKRNAYALRDIKEGEEILTEDLFDDAWDRFELY
jgi:hypothetical protein